MGDTFVMDPQWAKLHCQATTFVEGYERLHGTTYEDRIKQLIDTWKKGQVIKSNGITYEAYQAEMERTRSILSMNNTLIPEIYVSQSYESDRDAGMAAWKYLKDAEPQEIDAELEAQRQHANDLLGKMHTADAIYAHRVAMAQQITA